MSYYSPFFFSSQPILLLFVQKVGAGGYSSHPFYFPALLQLIGCEMQQMLHTKCQKGNSEAKVKPKAELLPKKN